MIIGLFQDAHNTSFRSHSWLKARGSISALVEGMDYDSLAFSTAGRQAPKLGTCLECRALVDIEFSLDRAGVYSTSPCPQCGSKRVRAVPDPASAEQQQQQSGGGSAAAGGADAMRRMQAMFAAFGLPADVQSAAMAAVSSIGNASGGGAASGAAAAASGSAAEAAAAALPSGGPIDAANLEALAAAQQGVDIDALMLALLQDASRKAPPALPSFVDALPNEPLAFADALEVWFEICAPRSASSGASPVTAADASATAISFTLPAFGPRLVSLHRRIDEDDASNGGDGMSQDDNERPPPARQVLGEAQIIVADDAEGAAPRNADQWRGKCVLFQRGKITFLEKVCGCRSFHPLALFCFSMLCTSVSY